MYYGRFCLKIVAHSFSSVVSVQQTSSYLCDITRGNYVKIVFAASFSVLVSHDYYIELAHRNIKTAMPVKESMYCKHGRLSYCLKI